MNVVSRTAVFDHHAMRDAGEPRSFTNKYDTEAIRNELRWAPRAADGARPPRSPDRGGGVPRPHVGDVHRPGRRRGQPLHEVAAPRRGRELVARARERPLLPGYEIALNSERSVVWERDGRHVRPSFVRQIMDLFVRTHVTGRAS